MGHMQEAVSKMLKPEKRIDADLRVQFWWIIFKK
jgi:hypothetical protein